MNHLGTQTLHTEHLVLRRFTDHDAQAMFNNWGSDPLTSRYLSWKPHTHVKETAELLTTWVEDYQNVDCYNWGVVVKDTDTLIGGIMVVRKKEKLGTCEIGFNYGSKFWGKGYATEALHAVCRFLLADVGYRLVEATHISANPASGRVMEKSGMKKDGILRQRRIDRATGEICDLITYSMIQTEL